jgi:hypothetical protein
MNDEPKSPFYRQPHKKVRRLKGATAATMSKEGVVSLAENFYKISEIAAYFRVSDTYISNHYGKEISLAHSRARGRLREIQWNAAKRGDVKMIIHMSKHNLDEHEQQKFQLQSLSNEQLAVLVQQRLEEEKTRLSLPNPEVTVETIDPPSSEAEADLEQLIVPEGSDNQ